MTEIDDLKRGADESLRQQRRKELIVHLTELSTNINKALKQDRIGIITFFVTWSLWVGGDLVNHVVGQIGFIVFIFGWSYSHHTNRELARALSAYISALKILKILGVIDPIPPRGVKNKKKRLQAMVDLMKKWATQKKKAQEEVYQPA